MAITEELPGVDVSIVVYDEALKEYHDDTLEDEDHTNTSYIEAASGQRFRIRVTLSEDCKLLGDGLHFSFLPDGIYADGVILRRADSKYGTQVYHSEGRQSSKTTVECYRFATLETGKYIWRGIEKSSAD